MIQPEIRIALKFPWLALKHPRWWWAFAIGGRKDLIRQIMNESILRLKSKPVLPRLSDLSSRKGVSAFSTLGATQEYLYDIVRLAKPETVVETGVYRGISSAFILAGLEANDKGHLYSIDLPSVSYVVPGTKTIDSSPLRKYEETGFAIPANLRNRWTLVVGDVRETLPSLLHRLGTIDMFYHDSEHTESVMSWEFELAWAQLRPEGILTTDDYTWNDAYDKFVASHDPRLALKLGNRLGVAQKNP